LQHNCDTHAKFLLQESAHWFRINEVSGYKRDNAESNRRTYEFIKTG